MIDFIDKTAEKAGTPISRKNMMALQGFETITTVFNEDGSITETNAEGHTLTTTFNEDGSITEVFVGEKTIMKVTTFDESGNLIEGVVNELG
jgi:YD repeat-containing protein